MIKVYEMHVIFTGIVQGVFFRALIKKNADKLKIKGFVKNNIDLSVELIAVGEKKDLEQLLDEIKKNSGQAHLKDVKVRFQETKKLFYSFEIRY
ncbi:MAG: Acylphosphatase [Candidatus Anoxychlamydiales bacterium]|nr:Acylphosphatase [Candidatus Anoxychlamydiales bacterium]